MPRIVPSRVVEFISTAISKGETSQDVVNMSTIGAPSLSATLALVDQIPDELLTMDGPTYAALILGKEQIKDILETWRNNLNAGRQKQPFTFGPPTNPLAIIRDALAKCPDESPSPSTSELTFIADTDLRMNLRTDIGAINRALSDGEWKGATVLAGSVIEALLLWALGQRPSAARSAAIGSLVANGSLDRTPPTDLDDWNLHQYTEVAANLNVITSDTAKQVRLAKAFRNLIHPGRAQRLAQKCDRGTALSAVAGVEHVVRDLS